MQSKTILTCAALSALFLLPISGAFAQGDANDNSSAGASSSATDNSSGSNGTATDNSATPSAPSTDNTPAPSPPATDNTAPSPPATDTTPAPSSSTTTTESSSTHTDNTGATTTVTERTTTSTTEAAGTIMDAGIFRDRLHELRDLMTQMRENNRLALAAQDPLVSSQYQEANRTLLVRTLGLLDTITRVWRRAQMPPADVAAADVSSENRFGTANLQRFANESEDTAFVRNAVWQLQDSFLADKLNGRQPMITNSMMSLVEAAIARADNPNFRVVTRLDQSRLASIQWPTEHAPFVWDRSHDEQYQASNDEWRNWHAEVAPPIIPQGVHYNNQQVAANPTTTEETTTTTTVNTNRVGAANNLPQTGGDPGLLYLLGSGFAGLGAFLRRRRS